METIVIETDWFKGSAYDCAACTVDLSHGCEGFNHVLLWNYILPYLNSLGFDLKPTAYRDTWGESVL